MNPPHNGCVDQCANCGHCIDCGDCFCPLPEEFADIVQTVKA